VKAETIAAGNERFLANFSDKICSERDVVDLLGLCYEAGTNRLLIVEDELTAEFFDLRTGVAGAVLQKFSTYKSIVALVVTPDRLRGRFGEMAAEARKNNYFRVFLDREEAVAWLALPGG
jgi:hypothetical protein